VVNACVVEYDVYNTPFMLRYVAHCYTIALHIVVFELRRSLVYLSKPMSGRFANLQSVIFRSRIFIPANSAIPSHHNDT